MTNTMRELIARGKSIVFITHKLKEVISIADRVTVIRRGQLHCTRNTSETDSNELARMMVGRDIELTVQKTPAEPGRVILDVQKLHALNNPNYRPLKGIVQVRAGKILGIAGVAGNGQSEFAEVSPACKVTGGKLSLMVKKLMVFRHARFLRKKLPMYLKTDSFAVWCLIFLCQKIWSEEFLSPAFRQRHPGYSGIKSADYARKLIKEFDVRTPDENVTAKSLSGGNQQKVILAREIVR